MIMTSNSYYSPLLGLGVYIDNEEGFCLWMEDENGKREDVISSFEYFCDMAKIHLNLWQTQNHDKLIEVVTAEGINLPVILCGGNGKDAYLAELVDLYKKVLTHRHDLTA